MMLLRRYMIFIFFLCLLPCACNGLDLSQIENDLGHLFGNFDTSDEANAYFDEKDTFSSLDLLTEDDDDDTGTDDDNEPRPPETNEAHTAISIIAMWGYKGRAPDDTQITATTWDPTFTTSCGKLGLKKLIRFEVNDSVKRPRPNKQALSFVSSTGRHVDGVLLLLGFEEADACDSAGTLTISSDALDASLTLDISELNDYHERWAVGENNHVSVVAQRIEAACNKGYLFGRWQDSIDSALGDDSIDSEDDGGNEEHAFGEFRGRAINLLGERVGYLKGRWGKAKKGKHKNKNVVFGKFIDTEGKFKALLAGHYREGHAKGSWYKKRSFDEPKGTFHFRYKRLPNIDRDGGVFRGRWAENACSHRPENVSLTDNETK
jgi:hypothetical protein